MGFAQRRSVRAFPACSQAQSGWVRYATGAGASLAGEALRRAADAGTIRLVEGDAANRPLLGRLGASDQLPFGVPAEIGGAPRQGPVEARVPCPARDGSGRV